MIHSQNKNPSELFHNGPCLKFKGEHDLVGDAVIVEGIVVVVQDAKIAAVDVGSGAPKTPKPQRGT